MRNETQTTQNPEARKNDLLRREESEQFVSEFMSYMGGLAKYQDNLSTLLVAATTSPEWEAYGEKAHTELIETHSFLMRLGIHLERLYKSGFGNYIEPKQLSEMSREELGNMMKEITSVQMKSIYSAMDGLKRVWFLNTGGEKEKEVVNELMPILEQEGFKCEYYPEPGQIKHQIFDARKQRVRWIIYTDGNQILVTNNYTESKMEVTRENLISLLKM